MKNFLQYLSGILIGIIISSTSAAFATTLFPSQGGTGFSTTTASNVGSFLQVVSTTPLRYTFGTTSVSGSSVTILGTTYLQAVTSNGTTTLTNIGVQSLQNATGTITITSNLTMTNRVLDTVQDIRSTSSPTFASTTLTGQLNVGTFADFPGISNPAEPAAGFARLHGDTTQGITRLEIADQCGYHNIVNRDNYFVAKNVSGSVMATGTIVYQVGSVGAVPTVDRAMANVTTTMPAIGFAEDQIASNGFGCFMNYGIFTPFDTSAFSSADRIYLSPTASGTYQRARPTVPNLVQRIGSILNSGAGNGSVLITIAPTELGRETGTINPTFNINGSLALTSSTLNSFITAGTGISLSTSSTGTITVSSNAGGTATSSVDYIKTFASSNSTSSVNIHIFDQAATIKAIRVVGDTFGTSSPAYWNFYYASSSVNPVTLAEVTSTLSLYNLTGNSNDSSGNGFNGTDSGVSYNQICKFGGTTNCPLYGSSNNYTTISDSAISLGNGQPFTLGAWFRANATLANANAILSQNTTNGFGANISVGNVIDEREGAQTCSGVTNINDQAWHWLVFSRDSSNNLTLYVDNKNDKVCTNQTFTVSGATIGNWSSHNAGSQNFVLQQVFFANTELSTSTRSAIYNGGAGTNICLISGCGANSITFYKLFDSYKVASTTIPTYFTNFNSSTPAKGDVLGLVSNQSSSTVQTFSIYYQ